VAHAAGTDPKKDLSGFRLRLGDALHAQFRSRSAEHGCAHCRLWSHVFLFRRESEVPARVERQTRSTRARIDLRLDGL
jgi:hypothetical protein